MGFRNDFIENGRPAYNFRGLLNIVGIEKLLEYMKAAILFIFRILKAIQLKLILFKLFVFFCFFYNIKLNNCSKSLIFSLQILIVNSF